jgi:GNAT superfamily N-acetyltransferase
VTEITTRYAESDDDIVAIHRFLCAVSIPLLWAPIDAQDSINEVYRVVRQECAVIAIVDNLMVGTMGLMRMNWWYNTKYCFMVDRWFFTLPEATNKGVGARLKAEAEIIAKGAGIPLFIMGKWRKDKRVPVISPRIFPNQRQLDVLRRTTDQHADDRTDA